MPLKRTRPTDVTPAGHLDESKLHYVLGYQLAQASIVMDALYMQHVGTPFELRPVEYTVLSLIVENPGGSLIRLARALAVTAPNITTWIDRLETRGLIRREKSETDRRSQVLKATPKGVTLVTKTTQKILEAEKAALAQLSAGEQLMLIELLHKVARAR
jgi:DNA-binding MarR family transcriptional regulator